MIREGIIKGNGTCLIDPHGEIHDNIVGWCALHGVETWRRIHLLDPRLDAWRTGFNPIKRYPIEEPLHLVDNAIEALAYVWGGERSTDTPAIRTVLRAVLTALIEHGQTLTEAFPLTNLNDEDSLRAFLTRGVRSELIRQILEGYDHMSRKHPREFVQEFGGPRRRLVELLHDDRICEMPGQVDSAINLRRCMDEGDIVLINFGSEGFDEARARALGALIVQEFFVVAKQRDLKTAAERPFYLYIDECAEFLTNSSNSLLAQTRSNYPPPVDFSRQAAPALIHRWDESPRS